IDLDFDLTGCEANWKPADGGAPWTGWLPCYDLDVSQQFTKGSAPHDALWAAMAGAGELTLRGQLDLNDMLRPAIQPGSHIDYKYPPESPTVTFKTDSTKSNVRLLLTSNKQFAVAAKEDGTRVSFTVPADAKKLVPIELHLKKEKGPALLSAEW